MLKSINESRYLGVEDLPDWFLKENCLIDVDFLENRTWVIAAGAYLVSITEIIRSCQKVSSAALLIVHN